MDCKKTVENFFLYFRIPIKVSEDTVINSLKNPKNKSWLNNLQQIFFFDLIQASGIIDNYTEMVDFFSDKKRLDFLENLFHKFNDIVSYRKVDNKKIDITGFEEDPILEELIFNDWSIEHKNPDFKLSDKIEYIKNTRYISLSDFKNILNPPSVFRFINKKINLEKRTKSMGFDIDGTLVNPSNILLPGVKEKLNELYKSGYNLILISNQKRRKIGDPKLKEKLEKIAKQIDLPFIAYCAREEDFYRKPLPGISYLIPEWLGKIEGFVGDAAGRTGDHSSDDLLLAKNLNIPFYTPEIYFNKFPLLTFEERPPLIDKNLILMIGYPGSGKSSYIQKNLDDFSVISRDELKTMEKCEKETEKYLKENKNVVIDNVNFKKEDRQRFIKLGKKYNYNIIALYVDTGMEKSMEQAKKREDKKIPSVVYYKLRKDFQEPELIEGFNEIFKIL